MVKRFRSGGLLLLLILLGLLTLSGPASGEGGLSTPGGLVPPQAAPGPLSSPIRAVCTGEPCDSQPLTYHGGPVMHTNTTYAIFWIPSGTSMTPTYENLITGYLQNVAAWSSATNNVYPVAEQYSDGGGHVRYASTYGGSAVATDAMPTTCKHFFDIRNLATNGCVSEADEAAEIKKVMAAHHWTGGMTHMFFLFTPPGVGSCFADGFQTNDGCAYFAYCGYHSFFAAGGTSVIWANHPYPLLTGRPNYVCDSLHHPNNDEADAALSVVSHEHNEAITDPLLNAWWQSLPGDDQGSENGDKCAWNFGTQLGNTASGPYNQVIGGGKYYLQQEWSNAGTECLLRMPSQPITISAFTPSSGTFATPVWINGKQLQDATAVRFNGTTASFEVVNPTQIATMVPTGATTGKISVVGPLGTVLGSADFKVKPVISSVSAPTGRVGDSITINGTGLRLATVKFGSVADLGATANPAGTQIAAHVPATATAGPITVTTAGGTTSAAFGVVPTVSTVSPLSGKAGDVVTITGLTLAGVNKVAFGLTTALGSIVLKSATTLTVKVPSSAVTGKLGVGNAGGTTLSAATFTVIPKLTSLSPTSGVAGTNVSINGTGLASTSAVHFNGVAATFTATATRITAQVPSTATTGTISVTTTPALAAQLPAVFKPLPKLAAAVGGVQVGALALGGTNLSGATALTLRGAALPITTNTATSITTTLPDAAVGGPLRVTTPAGSSQITLGVRPTITSLSATTGHTGDLLTVFGKTLKSPSKVLIGTVAAPVKSSTPTSVTVTVPATATLGHVTVQNSGGNAASADTFVVLPKITSFSPASGNVGTLVKIKGSGLVNLLSVSFNGTNATAVHLVSQNEVDANVPSGATDGPIAVHGTAGTATSTTSFDVTPAPTAYSAGAHRAARTG
jgi:hypothetical protein